MPRPSAACKLIDCERVHHARGLCRRHYGEQVRKDAKRERSAKRSSQAPQKVAS
jgi:hypothetical protein